MYGLYLKDQKKSVQKGQMEPFLEFQNHRAKEEFLSSIPQYIKDELDTASNLDDIEGKSELSD